MARRRRSNHPAGFGIDPEHLRVSALEDAMGSARIPLCYQVDGLATTAKRDGNLDSLRGGTVAMRKGEFQRDWHPTSPEQTEANLREECVPQTGFRYLRPWRR